MPEKFKNKYRIASNRWQNWDYSDAGSYFITICIQDREGILGKITNGKMQLSGYGEIVKNEFIKMGDYYECAVLDEWVIMPNHVHCIITLHDTATVALEKIHEFSAFEKIHEFSLPPSPAENDIIQYRRLRRKMEIPKLTGKFKMQTSKHINILRNTIGQKTWQANYHDHVIRNEQEYERIKHYIINNPVKWQKDNFNDMNNQSDDQNNNNNDNDNQYRSVL